MAIPPRRDSREYFCRHAEEGSLTGSSGLPGGGNTPRSPGEETAVDSICFGFGGRFYSVAQADGKLTM